MKNLVEVATNKMLNDVVDTTIRQALMLQQGANSIREHQEELLPERRTAPSVRAVALEEGARSLCQVLWRVFGGMPIDSIRAIERLAEEPANKHLAYESRDCIGMFMEILEEVKKSWS
jgi:hypothetical protein